ncbi:uncharacterized protein TRIADDRAFT_60178 [Trichoplax adhaerens]|uniref:Mitochondrial import inner membrane translocase subunit TIM23 n=1 Tax=Trichoplax adhaerens TaxID=10228 RepID=B3S7I5_TRIAD|nr:hypothetical protein TRIADDRAFT_60178 [Trichoplax adhaerens]EDV21296.1 hypothetical protein TRIADDRAFT_60178 [Trichoplax adhaerens]|eukprot:XP_002116263.1 hypothetical protein TRIADDRAFT_60178 [Trichoplax adhaerens]
MSDDYGKDGYSRDYSSTDPTMSASLSSTNKALLSPYMNIDPRSLHQDGSEFIFAGEPVKRRSWGERMFSNVGSSYMIGITCGGAWGLFEGLRTPHGNTMKLRINGILNSCTRRGPFVGNSLGCIETILGKVTQKEDEDNPYNTVGAAVLTGAIFKSTGGIRATALAAAIGGTLAVTYHFGQMIWQKEKPTFSTPNWSS